jgi:hypothetical protein
MQALVGMLKDLWLLVFNGVGAEGIDPVLSI